MGWGVGGGGSEGQNLYYPTLTPFLIFDRRPPSWYKFLSLSSLLLTFKKKHGGYNFWLGNTEYSLAKIAPGVQATETMLISCSMSSQPKVLSEHISKFVILVTNTNLCSLSTVCCYEIPTFRGQPVKSSFYLDCLCRGK